MTRKPPELNRRLARTLVNWHEQHRAIGFRDHNQRVVALRVLPPGVTRDYLAAVLRPRHFIAQSHGWCVIDEAVRGEVAKARALLDTSAPEAVKPVVEEPQARASIPATESKGAPQETRENEIIAEEIAEDVVPENAVWWPLCDASSIDATLKGIEAEDRRRPALELLKQRTLRWLPLVTKAHTEEMNALCESFPNFEAVIGRLRRHLARQALCEEAVHLPPLLLLGPPGVGKTAFGQQLAEGLGATFMVQSLAELTTGFALTSMTSGWSNAQPGLIAKSLQTLPDGQPLVVLFDELDKARQDATYPVDAALLGLLDPVSARTFRDEFLEVPLDLTPVSFLFTANRMTGIRPELLSRMTVIEVPPPTAAQMPAIVRSVDAVIRSRQPGLKKIFAPLDEALIRELAAQSPRTLMRQLEFAYDTAAEEALSDPGVQRPLHLLPRHLEPGSLVTSQANNAAMDRHEPADGLLLLAPQGPERVH